MSGQAKGETGAWGGGADEATSVKLLRLLDRMTRRFRLKEPSVIFAAAFCGRWGVRPGSPLRLRKSPEAGNVPHDHFRERSQMRR